MKNVFGWVAAALALAGVHNGLFTTSIERPVHAQAPAPAALQVANPKYVSVVMETTVNKPAAEVWKRVGKYCDIGEWLPQLACTMQSGTDGELGAVRSLAGGRILEILVAKTEYSYTYAQPVREGQIYNMYHGTLEARPVTPATSKLVYSLVFDQTQVAGDEAAKQRDVENRRTTFTRALESMKILAEGGTLPPPPARGGGAPGGGAPAGGRGN